MPIYDAAKAYATKKMKRTLSPEQAQNNGALDVGARDYINNKFGSQYGLKDSDIGFNNGMVTVKGMDAFKPNRVLNGRSFADPNMIDSSMNRVAVQGNLGIPEGYVKARDYINTLGQDYGIDNSQIGYQKNPNTGLNNVMIGGKVVGSGYINPADGRTYMEKSRLKSGVDSYVKENGLQNIKDVEKASVPPKYDSATLEKVKLALDKLSNRPKFEYSAENDPKFQALKGLYEKQGKSAFNNAIASLSAQAGGNNSWAQTVATQAQNAYNEKLMGLVPGMYQNAYNEYNNEYNKDLSNLDAVMKVDNNQYSKFRDTVGDNRNLRDYLSNKMSENKTFGENVRQNDRAFGENVRQSDRAFGENTRQFDVGVDQWNKKFDVGNEQWDKTFNKGNEQWDKTFNTGVDQWNKTYNTGNDQFNKTFDYKKGQDSIQNSLEASKVKESASNKTALKKEEYNNIFSSAYSSIKRLPVKDAIFELKDGAEDFINALGPDGYRELWNAVLGDAIRMGTAMPMEVNPRQPAPPKAEELSPEEWMANALKMLQKK